ncbi:MAG: hypothetical protein IIT44_05195, partial [Erysipelotrichaceae bacterium]|nr:hypothetical protein [Erysipelotrichaceae bacterium]
TVGIVKANFFAIILAVPVWAAAFIIFFMLNSPEKSLGSLSVLRLVIQSNSIAGTTYRFTETYFVTAFIYLCLTGISSIILNAIEKKLNHTKTSLPQSDTDVKSISIAKEGL